MSRVCPCRVRQARVNHPENESQLSLTKVRPHRVLAAPCQAVKEVGALRGDLS